MLAGTSLACRPQPKAALAGPEPTSSAEPAGLPAGSARDELLQQQDAILRQQDVIIAQQDELTAELRALRERLAARDAVEAGKPQLAHAEPVAPRRPGQPDPEAIYRVPIDGAQVRGSATAVVTVVEWADFQCPFCGRVEPTIAALLSEQAGEVRHVYMHNPLPMHARAMPAALAAEAAGRQGKFWEMYALLFANSKDLTDANFAKWAKRLRLNLKRFRRDLEDPSLVELIERQQKLAVSLGARGTPAFFINGRYLSGAQPKASFQAVIDQEKARAKGLLGNGTPPAKLYEALIADGRTEP